jgi:hypothetical protein
MHAGEAAVVPVGGRIRGADPLTGAEVEQDDDRAFGAADHGALGPRGRGRRQRLQDEGEDREAGEEAARSHRAPVGGSAANLRQRRPVGKGAEPATVDSGRPSP